MNQVKAKLFFALPLAVLLVACGKDDEPAGKDAGGAGDGGVPEAGDLCPDPANPRVHYVASDPNACIGVVLDCTTEQNGFQGRCGCGCIDKGDPICPGVDSGSVASWKSHDPAACGDQAPACPNGQIGFTGACGCGCLLPGGG